MKNFYAFHKNKRKKNFDAKELLKQCDINDSQKLKLIEFLKKDEKNIDKKEKEGEIDITDKTILTNNADEDKN